MNLPDGLKKLAAIFPVPLYAVGGAVRDFLCGEPCYDIDICSSLTPDELIPFLKSRGYKVNEESKRLGTLLISAGGEQFEYTAFREDSYPLDGSHEPRAVRFVKDIETDARRRDFTVNAIYYDIKANRIVDPLNGKADVEKHLIRTVRAPEIVFKEDALRLLRMVRFAASLSFEIEKETFETAKKLAFEVTELSSERIREELKKIFVADTVRGIKDAHVRGLDLLFDSNLLQATLPEVSVCADIKQSGRYFHSTVYNHLRNTYEVASPDIRFAALVHDIGKLEAHKKTGNYYKHDLYGSELVQKVMRRLKFSNAEITEVATIIRWHMFNVKKPESVEKIRLFLLAHDKYFKQLVKLMRADRLGGGYPEAHPAFTRLNEIVAVRKKMAAERVPFSLKELNING
ncbi:MAG: CCA tRNA nucleotidyltransferase, partial [Christensenellaceae bacterium]|nr:CCA tRNA nucleotidyltransferase [Christensenellaceae bacterium]